jgi:hypothetical protein
LSGEVASDTRVTPLPPVEGVLQLIRHTRVATGFAAAEYAARHLRQCERVVREVSVRRLERMWGLDELPQILRVVEEDLSNDAGHSDTDASVAATSGGGRVPYSPTR